MLIIVFLLLVNPVWTWHSSSYAVHGSWRFATTLIHYGRIGTMEWASGVSYVVFIVLHIAAALWGIYAGFQLFKYNVGSVTGAKLYFLVGIIVLTALDFLRTAIPSPWSGFFARYSPAISISVIYLSIGILAYGYLNWSKRVREAYPVA